MDDFTKDAFLAVFNKFNTYQGIDKLGLELVSFDLEENKEVLLGALKIHSGSLTKLSFAKNKVTNSFMTYICDGLAQMNNIEMIDLKHLKEAKNVNWVEMLKAISMLSAGTKKNVNVSLSGY